MQAERQKQSDQKGQSQPVRVSITFFPFFLSDLLHPCSCAHAEVRAVAHPRAPSVRGGTAVTRGSWAAEKACSPGHPFPPGWVAQGKSGVSPRLCPQAGPGPGGQAAGRSAGCRGSRPSRAGPVGGPKPGSISQPKPPAPLRRAASFPAPSRLPLRRGPAERFPPLTLLRPNGCPTPRGRGGEGASPSAHLGLLLGGAGGGRPGAPRSAVLRRRARRGWRG